MKKDLLIASLLLLGGWLAPMSLCAGLYYWIDENGIKHFSTHAPVGGVEVIEVIPEMEYDESADKARLQNYREWRRKAEARLQDQIRKAEAEEQARIAEQKCREVALKEALEEARLARELERLAREREERLYEDDKDDETIFVQPRQDPLGLDPNEEQRRIEKAARKLDERPLGLPSTPSGEPLGKP